MLDKNSKENCEERKSQVKSMKEDNKKGCVFNLINDTFQRSIKMLEITSR